MKHMVNTVILPRFFVSRQIPCILNNHDDFMVAFVRLAGRAQLLVWESETLLAVMDVRLRLSNG